MSDQIFINNILKLLQSNHLTRAQLAKELGVNASTVSMWLNGTNSPRIDMVKKIANVFNVSPSYLLGWDEPDTIAAHFDGDEYTETELEEIRQFAEFVKNKRK